MESVFPGKKGNSRNSNVVLSITPYFHVFQYLERAILD